MVAPSWICFLQGFVPNDPYITCTESAEEPWLRSGSHMPLETANLPYQASFRPGFFHSRLRRMRWLGLAKAGLQVRLTAMAYNLRRSWRLLATMPT